MKFLRYIRNKDIKDIYIEIDEIYKKDIMEDVLEFAKTNRSFRQ